jgi:hypothetical protein
VDIPLQPSFLAAVQSFFDVAFGLAPPPPQPFIPHTTPKTPPTPPPQSPQSQVETPSSVGGGGNCPVCSLPPPPPLAPPLLLSTDDILSVSASVSVQSSSSLTLPLEGREKEDPHLHEVETVKIKGVEEEEDEEGVEKQNVASSAKLTSDDGTRFAGSTTLNGGKGSRVANIQTVEKSIVKEEKDKQDVRKDQGKQIKHEHEEHTQQIEVANGQRQPLSPPHLPSSSVPTLLSRAGEDKTQQAPVAPPLSPPLSSSSSSSSPPSLVSPLSHGGKEAKLEAKKKLPLRWWDLKWAPQNAI